MSKYQIGDELKIREWDDMEKEFGLNRLGSVDCKYVFSISMVPMCGKDFTVRAIENGHFYSYEGTECLDGYRYDISSDMLEPRPEKPLYVATDDELKELMA